MKRILITGGGGFIGSHLTEYYAQKNGQNKITVIDNLSRANLLNQKVSEKYHYNWNYLHEFDNVRFCKKDLRNLSFVRGFLRKNNFDIIFHTAGQTAVKFSIQQPYIDFKNNLKSSLNLLEAIRSTKRDPKIIYCSTNKVFGTKINEVPLKEGKYKYKLNENSSIGIGEDAGVDLTQHTPYGVSKLGADLYFQEFGYTYGLKTNIFRMSCIYGPRQIGVEAQGWVSHFIISALTQQSLKIYGSGKQTRDILYISDLLSVFDKLLKKNVSNEVFCIGGGIKNTISPLKLIEILEHKLNRSISYEFSEWREGDQKYFVSDITKSQKVLNWEPKISMKEGLDDTVNWYKEHLDLFI